MLTGITHFINELLFPTLIITSVIASFSAILGLHVNQVLLTVCILILTACNIYFVFTLTIPDYVRMITFCTIILLIVGILQGSQVLGHL